MPHFKTVSQHPYDMVQGLTLRFLARGPKRYFDKGNSGQNSKTGFLDNLDTILGP